MKISNRLRDRFDYFTQCKDTLRLPQIEFVDDGYSALECFNAHESLGKTLPCREPKLLSQALNGKEQHGMTMTMIAEDFVSGLFFQSDLVKYPEWVQCDILGRASQIAYQTIGFVPKFISNTKTT